MRSSLIRSAIRIGALAVIAGSLLLLIAVSPVPKGLTHTPRVGSQPATAQVSRVISEADSGPAPAVPAATAVPAPPTPAPGSAEASPPAQAGEAPTGWVSIPALGLDAVPIFDRGLNGNREMQIAPGYVTTHYQFSGSLGGGSNAVLYGHEGSVFEGLHRLHGGDRVVLKLATGKLLNYVVKDNPVLVAPTQVSILNPTPNAQLTLFTCCCWPADDDNRRLVVVATSV